MGRFCAVHQFHAQLKPSRIANVLPNCETPASTLPLGKRTERRGEAFGELGYVLSIPSPGEGYRFGLRASAMAGFASLREVEPGTHSVNVTKGSFQTSFVMEVFANEITQATYDECLEQGETRIAVVTGQYDDIGAIIDDLGEFRQALADAFAALQRSVARAAERKAAPESKAVEKKAKQPAARKPAAKKPATGKSTARKPAAKKAAPQRARAPQT